MNRTAPFTTHGGGLIIMVQSMFKVMPSGHAAINIIEANTIPSRRYSRPASPPKKLRLSARKLVSSARCGTVFADVVGAGEGAD